jgi:hypothetical protein
MAAPAFSQDGKALNAFSAVPPTVSAPTPAGASAMPGMLSTLPDPVPNAVLRARWVMSEQ